MNIVFDFAYWLPIVDCVWIAIGCSCAMGEASIDKIAVRLCADWDKAKLQETLTRLQAAPVVQGVLAFVTAAVGLDLKGGWEDRNDGWLIGGVESQTCQYVSHIS